MAEANKTWLLPQHSAWQFKNLNFTSGQSEYRHLECLPANPETHMFPVTMPMPVPAAPSSNPGTCMVSANVPIPRSAIPGIPVLKEQMYEVDGLLQQLRPSLPTSLCHAEPCPKEKQSIFAFGQTVKAATNPMCGPLHKDLIIFDRSGNQTRVIYSSVQLPAQHATTAVPELASDNNLHEVQAADKKDPPLQSILQENSGENYASADQSEMHENTEEINALLYSDEESDYDDEEISTDRSPVSTKGKCQMSEQIEDVIEEVASSDGPCKRQRLLHGGYKISSAMDIACSVKLDASNEYDGDGEFTGESSCAVGQNQTEDSSSIFGDNLSKKDKIRMTLKILESLIPGAKGKDPLLVLDKAIDYLKSLKRGAMALGVYHY